MKEILSNVPSWWETFAVEDAVVLDQPSELLSSHREELSPTYRLQPGATMHLVLRLRGGCFAPGTLVRMGDGGERAIEEVRKGDSVLTEDPATGAQCAAAVRKVASYENRDRIRILMKAVSGGGAGCADAELELERLCGWRKCERRSAKHHEVPHREELGSRAGEACQEPRAME